jgi:hypothetical protein
VTKAQAVAEFRADLLPYVKLRFERDGRGPDYPARREEWNNWTDALCREGRITLKQHESWTHPPECGR